MAIFKFTAYEARDGRWVVFNLGREEPPFPGREIEAKTAADGIAAFEAYKREAEESGLHLAVSVDVLGRAPNGWRNAKPASFQFVNSPA